MTKKTELTSKLLAKIEPLHPLPEPLAEANLVEQGLYATLLRKLSPSESKAALERLRKSYKDWNELRISQAQEINKHLGLGAKGVRVARDVREYLQEIFQRSHGLDIEFLRDDPQTTQRFVSILPYIGMSGAHYLMWLAQERELPVTPALVRVLDRIGLVSRTASIKKARIAIEPIIPEGRTLEFVYRFGDVATRWCDARKPICHQCVLVDDCRFGKKAFRDWKVQQERLEQQRAREAVRLAILQKKDEDRRRRESERARKKAEAEAAKKARELARAARAVERKRELERERLGRIKAAADAKAAREKARKDEEARKLAERKRKVEAARKAEAKRKVDAKRKADAKKKKAAKAKSRR